ncbi:hypothetical protein DPEC_G00033320 [Dallia pectoralis]|uniref:Uncharacterized protein n=1 Tax=Dallia pectoralis TaxID=75939 RepID=A0ACC2HE75_DALPE|nr:hypothetical protein DPEC_G00033320 [Dallia pectoralis]
MSHINSNIHMAPHLSLLIIFIIFSTISADELMYVQTGGSITIPCCYYTEFKHKVIYLCKGSNLDNCKHAARTDKTMGTKTWITVYPQERVLTVTMTDLGPGDSDYYCCAVEINQGVDTQLKRFYLNVTSTPGLYVEKQEVTGVEGGEVTVSCYYRDPGTIKWCQACGDCVEYSGTIVGDNSIPVHITVKLHVTTQSTTNTTPTSPPQTSVSLSSGSVLNTSQSTDRSGPIEDNTTREAEGGIQKKYHHWLDLKILLILPVILVVLIAGVLVAWKIWRKHG